MTQKGSQPVAEGAQKAFDPVEVAAGVVPSLEGHPGIEEGACGRDAVDHLGSTLMIESTNAFPPAPSAPST